MEIPMLGYLRTKSNNLILNIFCSKVNLLYKGLPVDYVVNYFEINFKYDKQSEIDVISLQLCLLAPYDLIDEISN